jgi:thiamine kinase-like enzyme
MSDIEIKAIEKHNVMLKEHLQDQQNTIDRLQTMNKSHKTINGQLRVTNTRLRDENNRLRNEIKSLRQRIEDDQDLIKDLYEYP